MSGRPPHFWSLCLHKREDYARAGVPILPLTHGDNFTRLQILLYGGLLLLVSLLPFLQGSAGWLYLLGVGLINLRFIYWLRRIRHAGDKGAPMGTFIFSIKYLLLLFLFLLLDHYLMVF